MRKPRTKTKKRFWLTASLSHKEAKGESKPSFNELSYCSDSDKRPSISDKYFPISQRTRDLLTKQKTVLLTTSALLSVSLAATLLALSHTPEVNKAPSLASTLQSSMQLAERQRLARERAKEIRQRRLLLQAQAAKRQRLKEAKARAAKKQELEYLQSPVYSEPEYSEYPVYEAPESSSSGKPGGSKGGGKGSASSGSGSSNKGQGGSQPFSGGVDPDDLAPAKPSGEKPSKEQG